MSEREELIATIEELLLSHQRDAQWHERFNAAFSRVRAYLRENLSVRELGKRGGAAAKKAVGPDGYAKIGRKGGLATKKRGYEHYRDIGRMGAEKRFPKA